MEKVHPSSGGGSRPPMVRAEKQQSVIVNRRICITQDRSSIYSRGSRVTEDDVVAFSKEMLHHLSPCCNDKHDNEKRSSHPSPRHVTPQTRAPSHFIKVISLPHQFLTDDIMDVLVASCLLRCANLEVLDLSNNLLTNHSAVLMSECYAFLRCLRTVNLSSNNILLAGCEATIERFFRGEGQRCHSNVCFSRRALSVTSDLSSNSAKEGESQHFVDPPPDCASEPRFANTLDLSDNTAGNDGLFHAANAIRSSEHPAHVTLRNVGCGASGALALATCRDLLVGLDLSENVLYPELPPIEALCRAHIPSIHLRLLCLDEIVNDQGHRWSGKLAKMKTMSPTMGPRRSPTRQASEGITSPIAPGRLGLDGSREEFSCNALNIIAGGLVDGGLPCLESFSFMGNEVSNRAIGQLTDALSNPQCPLCELVLAENKLTDVTQLAGSLLTNHRLKLLDFSGNQLTEQSGHALFIALRENMVVSEVSLGRNLNLGNGTLTEMSKCLKHQAHRLHEINHIDNELSHSQDAVRSPRTLPDSPDEALESSTDDVPISGCRQPLVPFAPGAALVVSASPARTRKRVRVQRRAGLLGHAHVGNWVLGGRGSSTTTSRQSVCHCGHAWSCVTSVLDARKGWENTLKPEGESEQNIHQINDTLTPSQSVAHQGDRPESRRDKHSRRLSTESGGGSQPSTLMGLRFIEMSNWTVGAAALCELGEVLAMPYSPLEFLDMSGCGRSAVETLQKSVEMKSILSLKGTKESSQDEATKAFESAHDVANSPLSSSSSFPSTTEERSSHEERVNNRQREVQALVQSPLDDPRPVGWSDPAEMHWKSEKLDSTCIDTYLRWVSPYRHRPLSLNGLPPAAVHLPFLDDDTNEEEPSKCGGSTTSDVYHEAPSDPTSWYTRDGDLPPSSSCSPRFAHSPSVSNSPDSLYSSHLLDLFDMEDEDISSPFPQLQGYTHNRSLRLRRRGDMDSSSPPAISPSNNVSNLDKQLQSPPGSYSSSAPQNARDQKKRGRGGSPAGTHRGSGLCVIDDLQGDTVVQPHSFDFSRDPLLMQPVTRTTSSDFTEKHLNEVEGHQMASTADEGRDGKSLVIRENTVAVGLSQELGNSMTRSVSFRDDGTPSTPQLTPFKDSGKFTSPSSSGITPGGHFDSFKSSENSCVGKAELTVKAEAGQHVDDGDELEAQRAAITSVFKPYKAMNVYFDDVDDATSDLPDQANFSDNGDKASSATDSGYGGDNAAKERSHETFSGLNFSSLEAKRMLSPTPSVSSCAGTISSTPSSRKAAGSVVSRNSTASPLGPSASSSSSCGPGNMWVSLREEQEPPLQSLPHVDDEAPSTVGEQGARFASYVPPSTSGPQALSECGRLSQSLSPVDSIVEECDEKMAARSPVGGEQDESVRIIQISSATSPPDTIPHPVTVGIASRATESPQTQERSRRSTEK
eukprot:GHVN01067130.1.p1 GENE.GHVN01067130.1~~GHVN01067130.1.p1  ORF type:complete len:1434 (+),score=230.39 GHVN01067130.1:5847-10148(+)